MTKVLFVEWCADDVLGGTANMDPVTELAYRRIIDMIYSTNDKLLDNDSLQYATKAGSKWKKIRRELIEVHQKIYVEDGFIRNKKCSEKIQKSLKNIEQKSQAGIASAEKRKSLENKETDSTAVETSVTNGETTVVPTNQEPKNPSSKKRKIKKEKKDFDEFWALCPRKVGKGKAEEKYWKARDNISKDRLHAAMRSHKSEVNGREERFIPHPSTWLNEKRYLDDQYENVKTTDGWPSWKFTLAAGIGEPAVHSWFDHSRVDGNALIVNGKFRKEWIDQNYLDDINRLGLSEVRYE